MKAFASRAKYRKSSKRTFRQDHDLRSDKSIIRLASFAAVFTDWSYLRNRAEKWQRRKQKKKKKETGWSKDRNGEFHGRGEGEDWRTRSWDLRAEKFLCVVAHYRIEYRPHAAISAHRVTSSREIGMRKRKYRCLSRCGRSPSVPRREPNLPTLRAPSRVHRWLPFLRFSAPRGIARRGRGTPFGTKFIRTAPQEIDVCPAV